MKVRSISLRLALIYTAAFAVAVAVLGVVMLIATRAALEEQFRTRIQAESTALAQEYKIEGLNGVLQAVQERDRTPGALDYGLEGPQGRPLAGHLADARVPLGWSNYSVPQGHEHEDERLWTVALPDGRRLIVGDDVERIEALDHILMIGFALTLCGILALGGLSGYWLSLGVQRRFAAMSAVAEAISDGDLKQRMAVRAGGDDLDQLGSTMNRMLDRIGGLMDSLRQVSSDVAHDLRTPLTRLRQRLEAALASPQADARAAIEASMGDLDAILSTFAALLRIAQIEGGARRAGFQRVDLAEVAAMVVDSFAPSAEEGGRALLLEANTRAPIDGDRELLTQMLVNLVENGLHHTPVGATVRVQVTGGNAPSLTVVDDGPGVPEAEYAKLFDRFYRLEQSRSTPGNGLGLSLVAAVAKLHGAQTVLFDAGPGLGARVTFP
jgi:signal transduction histidine kinase